jgi:hypothetical protein
LATAAAAASFSSGRKNGRRNNPKGEYTECTTTESFRHCYKKIAVSSGNLYETLKGAGHISQSIKKKQLTNLLRVFLVFISRLLKSSAGGVYPTLFYRLWVSMNNKEYYVLF